jgi:hypothetical protein
VFNLAPPQEEVWKRGGIAPRIVSIGNRGRWVLRFTPRLFYSRWRTPAPTEQGKDKLRNRHWCCRQKKIIFNLLNHSSYY